MWPSLKTQDFKVKANAAIKQVQTSCSNENTKRQLVHALNEAIKLAVDRNMVAHNPLHLGMYTSDAGGIDFRLEVFSLRDSSIVMSLDKLSQIANTANELAGALHVLLGRAIDDT